MPGMDSLDRTATAFTSAVAPVAGNLAGGALRGPLLSVSGATPFPTPFSGMLHAMVNQTQDLSKQASNAVMGLLSGQGVEIHDVMIAQQRASASFELALQVRNKAVAAYQQLMGMQF